MTSSTCPDRGRARRAALALALSALAAAAAAPRPARAEPQFEPVLRLSLEGAYDSNPLFDGHPDERTRASPEVGLKVRDHLFNADGVYGADYLTYRKLDPAGVWNHRGSLDLDAHPTERTRVTATGRGIYAIDAIGLAQAGVFRTGLQRAILIAGAARVEQDLSHKLVGAAVLSERLVRFQDGTGGAMHAPSAELLWRVDERLLVGGAYAFTVFQDFRPTGDQLATAQGLRARARYMITRFLEADGYAGPAFWSGPQGHALVPEAGVELRLTERDWVMRVTVSHGLGLGSTATPGVGNTLEFGTVRNFGRTFDLRADGGIWQSGEVPSGRNASIGAAFSGEAGWHPTRDLRLAVAASWLGRLDSTDANLRRTTVGLRMSWELPAR